MDNQHESENMLLLEEDDGKEDKNISISEIQDLAPQE